MSSLTYIIGWPLCAAILLLLVPRTFRPVLRAVAILATFISAVLALKMFLQFNSGASGYQFEQQIPWVTSLGISYHVGVDGINVGLVLMGAIVAFSAACVSWEIKEREKEFYILLLVMTGGILGAFASLDLFFFYFFHELALVPTFIMIGVWGRGEQKNYATFQITIYLSIGALIALVGLIALYLQAGAGTFDIPKLADHIRHNPLSLSVQNFIFPLLLFGFGILVSLWPFHTWAPLGYGSAPTATAMLHAGVIKKFGLYGLIRIALPLLPDAARHWMPILAWLCLGNLVYCGWVAMRQRDFNRLIGYSSVAHMGFVFLGIATLNVIGVTGAVLVMIAHGFLAALTFGLSGYLYQQTGTRGDGPARRPAAPAAFHRRGPDDGGVRRLRLARLCQLRGRNHRLLRRLEGIPPGDDFGLLGGVDHRCGLYAAGGPRHVARPLAGSMGQLWPTRRTSGAKRRSSSCSPASWSSGASPACSRIRSSQASREKAIVTLRNPMNLLLLNHELLVLALALGLLLVDLWLPLAAKRKLGYAAAIGVGLILLYSLCCVSLPADKPVQHAFGEMYALDGLALFFKRFFLLAALIVLLMSVEFADRIVSGIAEFYALTLFALAGMLFAASANDFALLFVSLELITVTFYVLTSFQRGLVTSLEAGVKYLIIGALSTSFTVFGIALVYGISHTLNFGQLSGVAAQFSGNPIFLFGLVLVLVGLGFKIVAFPFQIWAPDVYQGAPTPVTAFLAVGSKAAGFALLLRVLFTAVPDITAQWANLLIVVSGFSILYGNLCAIPQRNLKRLLGYSSIAHAGYILLGIAALSAAGRSAVLYYLSGYLFTVLGAFIVICLVLRQADGEDLSGLAGLHRRSPLLAAALTLAMASLAGIPPLAGFFGKFLLLKAVIAEAPMHPGYYCLTFTALAGVVISLYFYFGVVRAIYWADDPADLSPIQISTPIRITIYGCIAGMLYLGLFPNGILERPPKP